MPVPPKPADVVRRQAGMIAATRKVCQLPGCKNLTNSKHGFCRQHRQHRHGYQWAKEQGLL